MAMGWWSAFQGIAVFLAVLVSTVLLDGTGWVNWQFWWMVMGVLTAAMIPDQSADGARRFDAFG